MVSTTLFQIISVIFTLRTYVDHFGPKVSPPTAAGPSYLPEISLLPGNTP